MQLNWIHYHQQLNIERIVCKKSLKMRYAKCIWNWADGKKVWAWGGLCECVQNRRRKSCKIVHSLQIAQFKLRWLFVGSSPTVAGEISVFLAYVLNYAKPEALQGKQCLMSGFNGHLSIYCKTIFNEKQYNCQSACKKMRIQWVWENSLNFVDDFILLGDHSFVGKEAMHLLSFFTYYSFRLLHERKKFYRIQKYFIPY